MRVLSGERSGCEGTRYESEVSAGGTLRLGEEVRMKEMSDMSASLDILTSSERSLSRMGKDFSSQ